MVRDTRTNRTGVGGQVEVPPSVLRILSGGFKDRGSMSQFLIRPQI